MKYLPDGYSFLGSSVDDDISNAKHSQFIAYENQNSSLTLVRQQLTLYENGIVLSDNIFWWKNKLFATEKWEPNENFEFAPSESNSYFRLECVEINRDDGELWCNSLQVYKNLVISFYFVGLQSDYPYDLVENVLKQVDDNLQNYE